ncbi:DUF3052 domain-containing protein [Mycetocola sp. 2940]|uniref:DUF3052 domain-containing protein n=1 Tax=Mycetocola sp. 2940 TaxID=3156452 RepID=UPI0033931C60
MAGYSPSSQSRKLGLKPGLLLVLDSAPPDWRFDDLPHGVTVVTDAVVTDAMVTDAAVTDAASADIVLSFVTEAAGIRNTIEAHGERIFPAGALWVAWPRKAAGHVSDVDENLIRDTAITLGLVDVKVAALTDDWSGLKLVWRVENRTRPRPLS